MTKKVLKITQSTYKTKRSLVCLESMRRTTLKLKQKKLLQNSKLKWLAGFNLKLAFAD